jgi:lysozyme family protein
LGQWVSVQRLSQDKLSNDRKAQLNALGFDWAPHDTAWEEGLEHFRAFVNEHKHCLVPADYKSPDGYKLGRWVTRRRFRKDTLSPEQIEILDALGFDWNPITTQWEEGFEHLQTYVREYKTSLVPGKYKLPDGYRLGGWVMEQRQNRGTLSADRKARLDALGFDWDPSETAWEQGFEHLLAYAQEYKNCRVPHLYKSSDGYGLGSWVLKQRQNRGTLSADREARLDALGFDWNPHDTDWEQGFEHLQAYAQEYKNCRVPHPYKSSDGYRLGKWVSVQRLSQDKLSNDRKARLDALGFDWDPITTRWEEGLHCLKIYKEREGDCHVPVNHKENDFPLGQWVSNQRANKKNLSGVRRQRLDELGFVWDALDAAWEEGFRYLTMYKEREGDCRVPAHHEENNFLLGSWVSRQRQKKARMSQGRIQRLDELGFIWKAR